MELSELPVLVLDGQATSPDPAEGHLLEMAWSVATASGGIAPIESRISRLPAGVVLPHRVARVTGLTETELQQGEDPDTIFADLLAAAAVVARASGADLCPAVIHFASFEERHLRWLHYRSRGTDRFPLRILCSHAIAKRALPGLPRLGLRAVAGYFGHAVSERRRSAEHVAATVAVWRGVVAILEREHGIGSLDELLGWLRAPRGNGGPRPRSFPLPQRLRQGLPRKPGVYRLLRDNGDVLYVGKATVLEDRVRSYFHRSASHPDHVLEMLSQARDLELVVTGSALEAALLEADEIKKLDPPYNRALRARGRSLFFASRRFERLVEAPDADHPIGPLAGGEMLWRVYASVAGRLEGDEAFFPEEFLGADETTLAAGFETFRRSLKAPSLLAHGVLEWLRETDDENEEFRLRLQYDARATRRATEESVCDALNDVVRRASHLVRRSHWLVLASESTLLWRGRDGERIALVLDGGRVRERRTPADGAPVPEPPHWRRSRLARRKRIDLAAYDRLTVLTTEMRRLLGEGREIELHLGHERKLDCTKLARMLRWI